ncbi:DUF4129 domain-containing protein [Nocardia abscessus]|uniref:DUF4129 domain-containing protein n=1 Tax=Nocardia abscessus TaxID=120957 RepID=UPI002454A58C|nr:DUF4129 domain-containing protein [Nocardia abscessus]
MIVLITLLAFAAIALRGYIPGITESEPRRHAPSALSVALMPVLLSVSIVILLAGVIASQHRLPLAMPEPEREDERRQWRLGRAGLAVLGALALLALLLAAASAIYFIGASGPSEPARPAAPPPTTGAPPGAGAPPPAAGAPRSPAQTRAPRGVGGVAVAMRVLGVAGLSAGLRRVPASAPAAAAAPTVADSLARAAEMGLAAMNAPGQDPRTAIIACYVAMERGLASDRSAAPLISDTPMEVLARAFERGALHDASARELVALFEEARFSPHAMLEWQRMRAEQLLRIVLADLQGEVPA